MVGSRPEGRVERLGERLSRVDVDLRRGDGIMAMPASRRHERLFGKAGPGRAKLCSAGLKLEARLADYEPRKDTCIRAFVRLLAERAKARQEAQEA